MTASERIQTFTVGDWQVDPLANRIQRSDDVVRIEPKAMQVLAFLAQRAGEVATRVELEDHAWAGMVVGPDALTNAIIKLRKALDDDARNPRFIDLRHELPVLLSSVFLQSLT